MDNRKTDNKPKASYMHGSGIPHKPKGALGVNQKLITKPGRMEHLLSKIKVVYFGSCKQGVVQKGFIFE